MPLRREPGVWDADCVRAIVDVLCGRGHHNHPELAGAIEGSREGILNAGDTGAPADNTAATEQPEKAGK